MSKSIMIYDFYLDWIKKAKDAEAFKDRFTAITDYAYYGIDHNEIPSQIKDVIDSEVKHKGRISPKYKEWRRKVFERDFYTCAICGKVGGELNAHHIKPYAYYPELRYEVNNGITLCKNCHKKVHRKN